MNLSFILDPFLLVASGIVEVYIVDKWLCRYMNKRKVIIVFSSVVVLLFWLVAGALYFDIINVPFLEEAGKGNYFMWNSGIELLGIPPLINISTSTYTDPLGLLNILAFILFSLYPVWLYLGILCGQRIIKNPQDNW